MSEWHDMTARQLVEELRQRRIGAEELTRAYLDRIHRRDGKLNTVAELDETALDQAKQLDSHGANRDLPLFGLPILIKDNIDVAGLHTTAGSFALSDNLALRDAPIVANLRRYGAIVLGKTNLTEFANYTSQGMPNGYSSRGGQVVHAADPAKDPSGSSTGSAVAMSAGLCAAAVGTDTSFSVVGCATSNGVTGLKPAHGALSASGIVPIAHTLDSAGALTRDLSDAHLVYEAMRGGPFTALSPTSPKDLRVAVNVYGREQVSSAQMARYEYLFRALRDAGAAIGEVNQPHSPDQKEIMRCEFKYDLEAYLRYSQSRVKTLSELVALYQAHPEHRKYGITLLEAALEETSGLDEPAYLTALAERKRQRALVREQLREYDACLMTGPTNIMHFTGLPSVALRLRAADRGEIWGLILYGADEQRLLSAALGVEMALA